MEQEFVNVYENGEIIGIVELSHNLDDFYTGSVSGVHHGLTRLQDGRYVLIVSSDWQGDTDNAYLISPDEAFRYIVESGNYYLFDDSKFSELKPKFLELVNKEMK